MKPEGYVQISEATYGGVWRQTMALRWRTVHHLNHDGTEVTSSNVLEQAFLEIRTGAVEWRPVPNA
jgi:hypothetical protein